MSNGTALLVIYLAGVAIGLAAVDGPMAARVGIAVIWPLGLAAFAVTVTMLLVVAAIAFPAFGIALAVALATVWFLS